MTLHSTAQADVRALVERIERLEEEKRAIADDIKEIYGEAKGQGFDVPALRAIVRLRRIEAAEREKADAVLDTYKHAVGMAVEMPLFTSISALADDGLSRDQLIISMQKLVPPDGDIIVKVGRPFRVWRDDQGVAHSEDYVPSSTPPARAKSKSKPATVITGVFEGGKKGPSADEIKAIADRAEASARDRSAKLADDEIDLLGGVGEPEEHEPAD
jgi:uncharacterized protein (UPF0335 family)